MSIRHLFPYPKELEATAVLPSGACLRIRAIRPEDESLLTDMVAKMSAEDLRMRFFTAITGLSHQLAARLSQIDYAREMALIAQAEQSEEILGVARFSADPDSQDAEFAVTVRSDWKSRGVGRALMARLIDVARQRKIGTLSGLVLKENDAMLGFCRDLGCAIATNLEDPTTVRVALALRNLDPSR
jgi:acetyltransferase